MGTVRFSILSSGRSPLLTHCTPGEWLYFRGAPALGSETSPSFSQSKPSLSAIPVGRQQESLSDVPHWTGILRRGNDAESSPCSSQWAARLLQFLMISDIEKCLRDDHSHRQSPASSDAHELLLHCTHFFTNVPGSASEVSWGRKPAPECHTPTPAKTQLRESCGFIHIPAAMSVLFNVCLGLFSSMLVCPLLHQFSCYTTSQEAVFLRVKYPALSRKHS